MRLLLAANNQATRRNEIIKSYLQLGSSSNRYAPRLPQQETKSSTKQLPPTGPILGPENILKTGFAQKGLPSMYFFDGWRVHPTLPIPATYHPPKKRQSGISPLRHPQLVRNQPARQKKKRETSLRQPPRIRRKMGQIQGGQRSAHVSPKSYGQPI